MSQIEQLVDLAAERVGGRIEFVTDEFFAPAANLLRQGRGVFIEDKYTEYGKWMDGWESRRRRDDQHDWCVIAMGLQGRIVQVCVDTNHFRGNNPESCMLEACRLTGSIPADAQGWNMLEWKPVVPRSPLGPSQEHHFDSVTSEPFTHARLHIYPDGGVARLRLFGVVCPDWDKLHKSGGAIDLAAVEHGGRPLACSDQFFSEPWNLLMPGRSTHMGDGWETRRRRGPGHDWVILQLGCRGTVSEVEVDTNHFKGNFPDTCDIEAINAPGADVSVLTSPDAAWRILLPRTKLAAHAQQCFGRELADLGPVTHLRLNIYPDGGVSRLRVRGTPHVETTPA